MERMKKAKTKQRFSLSAVALASVLMVSGLVACSKGENERPLNPDDSRVINLSANVQATTNTKAAVVGTTFPATTDNVFRLTAFSGAAAPSDWSVTPYFNDIQVNSGVASALTFVANQYYPANGDKVFFYGYAPQATSLTAGTASTAPIANYTITGQEDIMAAQETTGIAAVTTGIQPQPAMSFTHKLMQLRFKVVADASFETGKKVTEVQVKNVKNSAKLFIGDGSLTFDGAANQTFMLPITAGTNDEITAGGTNMDGCVMSEPVGTSGSVTLQVTADGVVYNDINVALTGTNAGKAGTSYLITLTFKRGEITPTATISDWVDVGGSSVDVGVLPPPPAIGDFINGGIVYWVDAVNPMKYKVLSLDQSSLVWSAKNTYVLDAAGQSTIDGKANVAAMKKYSADNTTNADDTKKTTGVFATDFPAAEFCDKKNTGGVTGWYLPAKDELKALSDAYTIAANKTAIDAGLAGNSGTAITASGFLWSSTMPSYSPSAAWYVNLNGNSGITGKSNNNSVRCVRNITPPPSVGDYYFTDGSFSSKLESGKTVNGMIYYIDPADPQKYKVMSLDEEATPLSWSASNTYVVSGAQSDADGKANSAAIKAAFDARMAGVAITESTFEDAFPAAAYCHNYKGKGGGDPEGTWYLPAKSELQYLWCAYNGVAPISWTTGADAAAPADPAKQTLWNDRIKAGGGAKDITSGNFWSSTEGSANASFAWYVYFSYGYTGGYGKSTNVYVRCVRDL